MKPLFVALFALLACGCACPKVYLPASDSTPPTITWNVTNKATSAVQTFTGSGSFTAKLGERFDVKMTATDSGGVNEASLGAGGSWQCRTANLATNAYYGGDNPVQKQDMWPSGEVCSEIVMFRDVDLSFDCREGYQFARGTVMVTGVGKNFHGGVTTARLEITVTP